MVDKTVASPEAAVAGIVDGSTVMIGGFGAAGQPGRLIDALIAQGARDLTVINNNAGNGETGLAALLKQRRVRKIICSSPPPTDFRVFHALYPEGALPPEVSPPGNLAPPVPAPRARIRALLPP